MERKHRLIGAGIVIAISALVVGAGIAVAGPNDDDAQLTGAERERAIEVALDHTPGSVTETEVGDDGAAYGVEIRRADGSEVEISLNRSFDVIATEIDDDSGEGDDAADD